MAWVFLVPLGRSKMHPRHHHLGPPLSLKHHLPGRYEHHGAPFPVAQHLVVIDGQRQYAVIHHNTILGGHTKYGEVASTSSAIRG